MKHRNKQKLDVPCVVVIAVFLILAPARTRGAASCPKPQTPKDVLDCVIQNSPTSERSRLATEVSKANEGAVGRFSNPSLSLQSGFISPGSQSTSDHQFTLTQPIDLGGKRTGRVREAEALTRQSTAEQEHVLAELTIDTLKKLNRLRQLILETHVLTETAQTLAKLVALFKNRPTLTPEQEASFAVFKTAQSDLDLKRLSLEEETRAIDQFFVLAAGLSIEDLGSALPKAPPDWVSVKRDGELLSPAKKRAEADLNLAIAELDSARASSWPEVAVGPFAQFQNDGTNKSSLFGVVLSLELPVLSVNQGGRAAAHKGIFLAEKNKEILEREEVSEQDRLFENYTNSVAALSKLPSAKELERDHTRLEKLFARGVVPSALVIESHRQVLELMRSRHEREEKALEALWKLQTLHGKISEATL